MVIRNACRGIGECRGEESAAAVDDGVWGEYRVSVVTAVAVAVACYRARVPAAALREVNKGISAAGQSC